MVKNCQFLSGAEGSLTCSKFEVSRVALLAATLVLSSSCIELGRKIEPQIPPYASSPSEGPLYYTETIYVSLNPADLLLLNQAIIHHQAGISIHQAPDTSPEFFGWVQIDVQKDHYDALLADYEKSLQGGSTIEDGVAKVSFPPTVCEEKKDNQGRIVQLNGICVRDINIYLPKEIQLKADLYWIGDLKIENVSFSELSLHIPASGKGILNGVAGDLTMELTQSERPSSFELQLDHQPVTHFPFHRGARITETTL